MIGGPGIDVSQCEGVVVGHGFVVSSGQSLSNYFIATTRLPLCPFPFNGQFLHDSENGSAELWSCNTFTLLTRRPF